jgi:microcystin-dependent protein
MSEPYLGEIRLFAGNFAPVGNAYCAGQLLSVAQNSALFSLLGTFYGGNGQTNFALPDLQGRLPVCYGQGNGLTNYPIGAKTGSESVTLLVTQIPAHTHMPIASSKAAAAESPAGAIPATLQDPFKGFYVQDGNKTGDPVAMSATAVQQTGGSQPHENRMPALAISIIIALQGVFPSRN